MYTGHHHGCPDRIILRVANDVDALILTLSDGRRVEVTLFSDPTHLG